MTLSWDVHGAVPVTFPKRRSQVANGTLESCSCCHQPFMDKETFDQDELLVVSGNEMEARMISASLFNEVGPSTPDSFNVPMSFFLF